LAHAPPRWGYELGTARFSPFKARMGRHAPDALYLLPLALAAAAIWLVMHRLGIL
jgi:hypothetical protein